MQLNKGQKLLKPKGFIINMKKIFIFSILFLLSLTFVSAALPVTTVQEFPEGYVILEAQQPVLKAGENHTYYFFLYNSSDGKQIDNTTVECKFYMADEIGEIVIEEESIQQPNGYWKREIPGDKLEDIGFYSYGVSCQDGNGGALAGTFEVTPNGDSFNTSKAILLLGALIIILTLLILTIRGMLIVDNFGWNFGFLNIAYLLLNIFFFVGWKIFSNYLYEIPSIGVALHSMWIVSNIVWIPFILGQVAYLLLTMTEETQINKLVKMGYSQDEANSRIRKRKKR